MNLAAQETPADENNTASDTTFFKVGKKQVEIIERNDSTFVKVTGDDETEVVFENSDETEDEDSDDDDDWEWSWSDEDDNTTVDEFRGHWAGFEFGMNNYVDNRFAVTRTAENDFMDVNTSRSWNLNLNFTQYSLDFNSRYVGLVTGLGLEWSNYHFENHTTITKNPITGVIEPKDIDADLTLNRFQTTYLTLPLLLELQFFSAPRSERMYISAGVIGAVKLGAHTKVNTVENGSKTKDKTRSDFNLRPIRYGVTGRVGFKLLKIYCNYYPVSLFLPNKGPELYPIAMGFSLAF